MPLLTPYLSRARTRLVVDHLRGDVLDVGCQRGQLRDLAGDQVGRYVGIDLSADAIDAAAATWEKRQGFAIGVRSCLDKCFDAPVCELRTPAGTATILRASPTRSWRRSRMRSTRCERE